MAEPLDRDSAIQSNDTQVQALTPKAKATDVDAVDTTREARLIDVNSAVERVQGDAEATL